MGCKGLVDRMLSIGAVLVGSSSNVISISPFLNLIFHADFSFIYIFGNLIDPASAAASQASKEEVDLRSVFVGNVSALECSQSYLILIGPGFCIV